MIDENLQKCGKFFIHSEYSYFQFKKEEIQIFSEYLKICRSLTIRIIFIIKYVLSQINPELYKLFISDAKQRLYRVNKADFEMESIYGVKNRKGPYLCFHDDPEYIFDSNEIKMFNSSEQTSKSNKLTI
jgi:hypothetical protein